MRIDKQNLQIKQRIVPFCLIILFSFFSCFSNLFAEDATEKLEIGINERLGEIADFNFTFNDEDGNPVIISDLIDRPTIISFVYYSCPSICSPLLNGLSHAVDKLNFEPGKDYNVITVSINKDELPLLAQQKKTRYLKGMEGKFPPSAWHWLTGDSVNIKGFTDELGFAFRRTGKDFAHSAVIMVVNKEAKISRYIYGTQFNQFDLQLAIIEASESRVGPAIAKVLKFCFSYDPEGRKYAFDFMRIMGGLVLLCATAFVAFLVITGNRNAKKKSA